MFGKGRAARPNENAEAAPYCSFCNKGQNDVRKLIAGPTVMICDECVRICVDIIVDDAQASGAPDNLGATQELQARLRAKQLNAAHSSVPIPDEAVPLWHVRCALCRQIVPTDAAISIESRGVLCESCLAAVQGILRNAVKGERESE